MRPLVFRIAVALLVLSNSTSAVAQTLVPPKLTQSAEATYPKEAQEQGLSGSVLLQLDIDATGAVTTATVAESGGHGFDEAAVEAAKKFVFEPATKDGKAIPARIKYRYTFTWKATTPDVPVPTVPTPPVITATKPALETGELHGVVRIGGADEPLEGASVSVTSSSGVALKYTLGKDGSFDAKELAPGVYHVTIESQGFVTASADETVEAGKRVEVTYRLVPVPVEGELVVVGKRPPREVTVHTLEKRELERIPGTNGDALKGIQTMPGVGRSPGLGAQLIVRGAAPQDTQVFVEGVPIPIVYHFGGVSSVIPTEMLDRIDFRPGNFGTEYGRVMGGIVDVRMATAPIDGKYHALAQADFIDARFVAKGPIPLLNGWSFVAGARRSYVDLWLKPVLERRGGGFTAAPVYYDYQAFVEKRPSEASRIRIGFYGSDDSLTVIRDIVNTRDPAEGSDLDLHVAFGRFQGSFEAQLSNAIRFNQTLAYGWDLRSFQNGTRGVEILARPFTDRSELSFLLAKGFTLHLGTDVQYTTTKVNVTVPPPRVPGEPASGSSNTLLTENDAPSFFLPAIYSEMEMQLTKRLRIVPGFRIDYTGATQHFETSPRVSARYDVVTGPDKTTLKGGIGMFYQPPQPLEISPVFGTPGLYANRSTHASFGIEQSLFRRVEVSIEGFYKSLDNLVARSPSSSGGFTYDNLGTGSVFGSEVLVRYKPDERFFGWIAYTLSRSVRRESSSVPEHLFQFDQTHILTVLGSYRLGGGWELGARFRFVSGNLFTPCLGGVMDGTTGSYTCISGSRFSERLPPFHQIDLRLDKHWYFDSWQVSAYLDVYNAYNRGNPEGIAYNFDFSQKIYQTGLPIIPSMGLRGEF